MNKLVILMLIIPLLLFAKIDLAKLVKEGKAGNKHALYQLGFMYENGINVDKDLQVAKRYYRQAAELGSEDAKLSLSLMDLSDKLNKREVSLSNSVTVRGSKGLKYKLSVNDLKFVVQRAKKLDKDAIFTLATIYDNGYGDIKIDTLRAMALYRKAVSLGSKKAKKILLLKSK